MLWLKSVIKLFKLFMALTVAFHSLSEHEETEIQKGTTVCLLNSYHWTSV